MPPEGERLIIADDHPHVPLALIVQFAFIALPPQAVMPELA